MTHKLTISSVAYLSDCAMELGSTVYVEDTGKIFRCIPGFSGGLIWELESKSYYGFPETQLQEIEFEAPREERTEKKLKLRLVKAPPKYLH